MVTASKLEKDRLYKLMNLSNSELDDYIEKLVLDAYKGVKNGVVSESPEMDAAIDKLDEITDITLQRFPNANIKEVIKDRKFRYMNLAYLSAVFTLENYKSDFIENATFLNELMELEMLHYSLKELLRIYYDNYSNYGFMEDLLMDLSDDGLAVDSDIREKYVFSKKYGMNEKLMFNLDIEISVTVDLILDRIAELDVKYLVDNTDEINAAIDGIHDNIKSFYKTNTDFEIAAYKQSGLLDAELETIKSIKNHSANQHKFYLESKEKILELINGNGFEKYAAKKFERIYKDDGDDADFDEWMKKQPKYDVRNAKFIYPEVSECEYV